jgi:hypothetical protein
VYKNHYPRRPSDNYQTPVKLAHAICQRLATVIPSPKRIVEPSAGLGYFVSASKEFWPSASLLAVEIRDECEQCLKDRHADEVFIGPWEDLSLDSKPVPDLIIGNPPYEFAQEHLRIALNRVVTSGHVAFLLRMAFLNSQERVNTLWDTQPGFRYLLPLAQRPSFTGDGKSEHSEYAVYIFQKGWKGNAEILPHLWVEK